MSNIYPPPPTTRALEPFEQRTLQRYISNGFLQTDVIVFRERSNLTSSTTALAPDAETRRRGRDPPFPISVEECETLIPSLQGISGMLNIAAYDLLPLSLYVTADSAMFSVHESQIKKGMLSRMCCGGGSSKKSGMDQPSQRQVIVDLPFGPTTEVVLDEELGVVHLWMSSDVFPVRFVCSENSRIVEAFVLHMLVYYRMQPQMMSDFVSSEMSINRSPVTNAKRSSLSMQSDSSPEGPISFTRRIRGHSFDEDAPPPMRNNRLRGHSFEDLPSVAESPSLGFAPSDPHSSTVLPAVEDSSSTVPEVLSLCDLKTPVKSVPEDPIVEKNSTVQESSAPQPTALPLEEVQSPVKPMPQGLIPASMMPLPLAPALSYSAYPSHRAPPRPAPSLFHVTSRSPHRGSPSPLLVSPHPSEKPLRIKDIVASALKTRQDEQDKQRQELANNRDTMALQILRTPSSKFHLPGSPVE